MKNETIISLRQLVESAIDCASKIDLKETKNNPDVFISIKNIDRVGEDVILVKID